MDTDRLKIIHKRQLEIAQTGFPDTEINQRLEFHRLTLDVSQIVCGGITFAMLLKYVEHGLENGVIPNVAGLTLRAYK